MASLAIILSKELNKITDQTCQPLLLTYNKVRFSRDEAQFIKVLEKVGPKGLKDSKVCTKRCKAVTLLNTNDTKLFNMEISTLQIYRAA